jgi:hypothetical protein
MNPRLSASKVEQIAAAYEAGATVRQVAAQFGAQVKSQRVVYELSVSDGSRINLS